MAGNVGNLNINLLADTQPFIKGMSKAANVIKDFETRAKLANYQLQKLSASGIKTIAAGDDALAKSAQKVIKAIGPTTRYLAANNKELRKSKEAAENVAISVIKATDAQNQFNRALKTASNSLWLMGTGLKQLGTSLLTNFTIPLVGAAGASLKVFTDWEKGTSKLQSAAEITSKSAESITNSLIEISLQVPLTVDELQQAAVAAAKAGVEGEKAISKFAETTVKLSKVGGDALKDLPLDQVSDSLAQISIAFGIAGDNFEKVTNVASMLLRVGKDIPGGLSEIFQGMRRVSAGAVQMGVSIEQTTAMIGTLVAAAVPAARAGTELTAAFRDFGKNTNWDYVATKLGYTTNEIDKFIDRLEDDFGGVLIELLEKISGINSSLERSAVIGKIFGETGRKAIEPLVNNVELLNMLLQLSELEFERNILLENDFAVQSGNLAGTFTVFGNAVKALGKAFADDLAPYVSVFLQTAIGGLKMLMSLWQSLSGGIKFLLVGLGGLLTILGPLILGFHYLFVKPLGGLITFYTFLKKLSAAMTILRAGIVMNTVSLSYYNFATIAATTGNTQLAASYLAAAKGASFLNVTLLPLLATLKTVAIVAVAALAALWLLKKIGINVRLPSIKYKKPEVPSMDLDLGIGDLTKAQTEEQKRVELEREESKKALKAEEKAVNKELKAKQKQRKKELRILEDGIDEYEKIRKKEIDIQEKLVDEQRQALDIRREQWEDEKRIEDEKIRGQKETLDAVKKTLKLSKQSLRELEKVMDAEVDTAENRVEFAEMNLEAAQDALKREKILGRDEFDESFRLAEARVEAWEAAVQLARENVLKVKKEYQKQIDVQEDLIDINQEQVDVQTDALDKLKVALDERRAIVDKEIDLMDDELKVRQEALDLIRDNTQEKLDILREEKNIIQRAYDDEIDLIQDRLDAIREQNEALADATGGALDEIPASLEKFKKKVEEAINKIQEQMDVATEGGIEVDYGGVDLEKGSIWEKMKKSFEEAKKNALEEGKGTVTAFFEGIVAGWTELGDAWNKFWIDALFGEGTWNFLKREAGEKGTSIIGVMWKNFKLALEERKRQVGKAIKENILDPIGKAFEGFNWENIKNIVLNTWYGIRNKSSEIFWQMYNWVINIFYSLRNKVNGIVTQLKDWLSNKWYDIRNKANNIFWQMVDWVVKASWKLYEWIKTPFRWIGELIKRALDIKWKRSPSIVDNVKSGVKEIKNAYRGLGSFMDSEFGNKGLSASISNSGLIGASQRTIQGAANAQQAQGTPATQPIINRNIYIQPKQMIATRGEVRNFARMLKEYDEYEARR